MNSARVARSHTRSSLSWLVSSDAERFMRFTYHTGLTPDRERADHAPTLLRYHSFFSMRIAFVVADVAAQSPTYGTLYLARAALHRGHQALFVGVDELTFSPEGRGLARAVRAPGPPQTTAHLATELAAPEPKREELDLSACEVVFLRYTPTRESKNGAAATPGPKVNPAVEFGWRLRLGGTLVI